MVCLQSNSKMVRYLIIDFFGGFLFFFMIAERCLSRSGYFPSKFAWLFCSWPPTEKIKKVFFINNLGKLDDSHVSVLFSVAHIPTPCFTSTGSSLVSLLLRRIAGMHPEHSNSQSQPLAPGLGRGKSKPAWRLPSFLRAPQISLTAGLCRA